MPGVPWTVDHSYEADVPGEGRTTGRVFRDGHRIRFRSAAGAVWSMTHVFLVRQLPEGPSAPSK